MNNSELTELKGITASTKGSASILAWNLIALNTGELKDYKFRFPDNIDNRKKVVKPTISLNHLLTEIKVYPSPAHEYVVFEYHLPEEMKEALILVTDLSGKSIAQLPIKNYRGILNWDTRDVAQGVYVYKIIYQERTIRVGKITILK